MTEGAIEVMSEHIKRGWKPAPCRRTIRAKSVGKVTDSTLGCYRTVLPESPSEKPSKMAKEVTYPATFVTKVTYLTKIDRIVECWMSPRNAKLETRRETGLTLVELMLVVAIIGLLAGIAIPKYKDYQERIKQTQAIQDIKILQMLIRDYELDGGSLPASLANVGNDGKLDPWGRLYVYQELASVKGHGKARKDHKLNPLNSDFDLYSLGKDGASKTQLTNKESLDDIVRALDGAFVGLATDFVP